MPHFTIEYSANLDTRVDMGKLVELVRKAAVETGVFPIGGIRVRAIRCEHYAIANGEANFGFLAMVLRLGEGRDHTQHAQHPEQVEAKIGSRHAGDGTGSPAPDSEPRRGQAPGFHRADRAARGTGGAARVSRPCSPRRRGSAR